MREPRTREEAVTAALDSMAEKVEAVLRESYGDGLDHERIARRVMDAAGIKDQSGIKMWDPLAIVGIKADFIAVVEGTNVVVVRPDPTAPSVLERPGSTHEIFWGNGGRPPKWISGLRVSKVSAPEAYAPPDTEQRGE